jgi:hypothetical protein
MDLQAQTSSGKFKQVQAGSAAIPAAGSGRFKQAQASSAAGSGRFR